MVQPESLRILGEDWAVIWLGIGAADERAHTDGEKRTIVMGPHAGREDLLHEVIHAIEFSYNLDIDHTELQIVARGIWAICKDNPEFLEYLEND
jgi:hypothetical protein